MATTNHSLRALGRRSSSLFHDLWRRRHGCARPCTDPPPCQAPTLRNAELAAVYHGQRIAGDFYEFIRVNPFRVLFALLDVAGRRADTREVLIAVQGTFRTLASTLFSPQNVNEAEAMSELCHEMSRTILWRSGGVRSCPAFVACYNENLGTLCYGNAGHTPGILVDASGTARLEATGLPLGLFSHTVHGSYTFALVPGSILAIVSRGLEELVWEREELVMEGVLQRVLQRVGRMATLSAPELCTKLVQAACESTEKSTIQNDLTVLALIRSGHK